MREGIDTLIIREKKLNEKRENVEEINFSIIVVCVSQVLKNKNEQKR